MRLKFYILVLFTVLSTASFAQVANYSFAQSSGTYTEITGGTVLGNTTSDDERFVDPAVPLGGTTVTGVGFPIGFSFTYNGIVFDRFAVNNNGWIGLGQSALTPSVDINTTSAYTPLSSAAANTPSLLRNRIAGFGRDIQAQAGAELRFQTIGAAPNRQLVVQYKNYKRFGTAGTGDGFNFQIVLTETTNTVQVIYGAVVLNTVTTASTVNHVGLGGTVATDFNNRQTTAPHNWNTTTAGTANTQGLQNATSTIAITAPVSGLTFTWTPPACTITCPANITVNVDAGQCGAIVSYTAPTTTGPCGPVTVSQASGTFFPRGVTTVTATEPGGGSCSFTVTVVDNILPVLGACPANITTNSTAALCGAVVTFTAPTATDNCPGFTVVSSPASGSVFPVGTTTVTTTATDVAGNTASCTFTVTVNDITPPVITCPANITVSNTANQCGAIVNFAPTAVDNCATVTLTQSASTAIVALNSVGCPTGPNSYWRAYQLAATGPVRINTVTFAIEAATTTQTLNVRVHTSAGAFPGGVLTQVATQAVTVAPADNNTLKTVTFTTPATVAANAIVVLEINAPNNPNAFFIGSNAAGQTAPSFISAAGCGAPTPVTLASLGFPGMHIVLNAAGTVAVPVVSAPASGTLFPVGTTTVTSTATDAAGNTASCTFTVRVNDTQAPAIVCPANITATTAVGVCTAPVTYAVTGTDNCPGVVVARTAGPASGSAFPVGVTTVTHTATDAAGNVSTCSFTVTVIDGQLPVISTQPVNRTVCIGSNTTFNVTSTNAVSYQWQQFIGGVWTNIAGATGATLTLNGVTLAMNTNSYRVNVIGLCTTVTSGFASLYVNPLPTITLAASNPPVLLPTQQTSIVATVVPTGGTFAWFKNGAPRVPTVTGNTLSNLTVEDAGTYRAVYTDPNGCVNTSADLVLSAEASDRLFIAPNPNFGQFWVRFYNQTGESLTVKVFNAAGSLVYQKTSATALAYTRLDVSLGNAAPGIYLVELRGAGGKLLGSRQIIVSHR